MVNWDAADLSTAFEVAGFDPVRVHVERHTTELQITPALLARWFAAAQDVSSDGRRSSYAQRLLTHLAPEEARQIQSLLERNLRGQTVAWVSAVAYLLAQRPE